MFSNTLVRLVFSLTLVLVLLLSLSLPLIATETPQTTDQIPRISVEGLLKLMEQESVVVVDARVTRAWNRAGNKIPDAIRLDTPGKIAHFADTTDYQQAILVYCL